MLQRGTLGEALTRIPAGAPGYLTIDLDVLSPEAIGGAVSTPVANGLTWDELFEIVEYAMARLDVLSPEAIGGAVSTPVANGLTWDELFEIVEYAMARLDVVACDLVEFHPDAAIPGQWTSQLSTLILLLIEGLAAGAHRRDGLAT